MVSRKYPPLESLRRAHCSERLSPNPIGRRRGIEKIAGNEHMPLGIERLSDSEGLRPDRQSDVHRAAGGQD